MIFLIDRVENTPIKFTDINELLNYISYRAKRTTNHVPEFDNKSTVANILNLFGCNENDKICTTKSIWLEQLIGVSSNVPMKTINLFSFEHIVPAEAFVKKRFIVKDERNRIIPATQIEQVLKMTTLKALPRLKSGLVFKFRQTPVPYTSKIAFRKFKRCSFINEFTALNSDCNLEHDETDEVYSVPVRLKRRHVLSQISNTAALKSVETYSWKSHCKKHKQWMKYAPEAYGRQSKMSKTLSLLMHDWEETERDIIEEEYQSCYDDYMDFVAKEFDFN